MEYFTGFSFKKIRKKKKKFQADSTKVAFSEIKKKTKKNKSYLLRPVPYFRILNNQ